mgnify:CR=1 FL=1
MSLFKELKRRNVFRVGITYAAAGWVLLQVLDVVAPLFELPDWVARLVFVLLAIGLVPTLLFAWAFEITPEGIKREHEVDRSESATHHTAKRLDQVTIGLLVLVVAIVILDRSMGPGDRAPAGADVSDKSIAVLAFEDLSQEGDQAWFAEGLSEELLNLLAQVPDLQVAGRTSSFAFKGQQRDLREIGEILNVAHVLEGSVRKAGNRIRVTAQLVNTADGYHLFSQTYDDELSDIFGVQDDIARQITDALKAQLIGEHALDETAVTDPRTYELYLEARQKLHTRNGEEMAQASELLDAALIIDPDYAPALAQKALAIALLSDGPGFYGDVPQDLAFPEARKLLDKALSIDPELAEAHAILGIIHPASEGPEPAIAHLRRAVAINPNLDNANLWLAAQLGDSGRDEEEVQLLEKVLARDPLFTPAFTNLVYVYTDRRQFDRGSALIDRFERAGGSPSMVAATRANQAVALGRYADATRLYERSLELQPANPNVRNAYGSVLRSLGNYEAMRDLGMAHLVAYYELYTTGSYDPEPVENTYPPGAHPNFFAAHSHLYALTRNFRKTIDVVETDYGGLDELLSTHPQTGSEGLSFMPFLALAYRELGHEPEFEQTMAAIRKALDAQQQRPVNKRNVWFGEASFAALRGDVATMQAACQTIVDLGDVDAETALAPATPPYANEPALQPCFDTLRARAQAARAELGWPPYEPMILDGLQDASPRGAR